MREHCTWHPLIRWLLFVPAGVVAMCLARGFVILAQEFNDEGRYWGQLLACAVESWAFLAASLWMLPRFHRAFTILFSVPYVGLAAFALWLDLAQTSQDRWSRSFLMLVSLASGTWAGCYFYREPCVPAMNKENEHLQDDLWDYAIIGASHMAHGVTNFSEWSEMMLKEGDPAIRPYLQAIFDTSQIILDQTKERFSDSPESETDTIKQELRAAESESATSKRELQSAEREMDMLLKTLFQHDGVLLAEFTAEYRHYKINNPKYFDDPNWVQKLEAQCKRNLLNVQHTDNPANNDSRDAETRQWAEVEVKSVALYGPKELRARKNQRYVRWLIRRYSEAVIRQLLSALSHQERPLCAQMLSEHDIFHDDLTAMIDPFEYGGRHFHVRAVKGNKYTVEISISLGRLGDGGTLTFERRPDGEFVHCDEDEQFVL